jgi:hypothetical protein
MMIILFSLNTLRKFINYLFAFYFIDDHDEETFLNEIIKIILYKFIFD